MLSLSKRELCSYSLRKRALASRRYSHALDPSKISDLRTIGTQTLEDVNSYKERANVKGSFSLPSCFYMEQRRSAMFWHSDDEPAPQWLIEEALNKGKEICTEYETTISKLQRELNQTKSQLKETIEQKDVTQYQFERALGNMKSEAEKQYEAMQEKIVDICTSILDKFQSSIIYDDTDYKHNRRAKHCGELSKNLRKKLQRNSKTLARMKTELRITRTALREKSESFETLNKWFVKLKLQLDTTEVSMRELLAENSLLHKKNEQSKECIECKTRKEPDDKNNPSLIKELQKSREIINLKKKAEEDNITITQLRNKLQRLESAHNNRGILLSNYKNQINDLEKGKDQHENKIKQLENENNNLRSTVVQLKSKASYLTKEKSKLLKDVQALQRKAEALNINYNNELIFMKNNLEISNNCNIEYYNAFKEFLMKMKSYEEKIDAIETTEKSDEGKGTITQNWKEDLRDIISQKSFASNLAEFLFQHLVSKNTS
ncbi:testis-specific gene 10 protein-like [Prorops nasuta]|uniref:testis-specific gene 10 protein-like n=1 Tax=Prorops nasuta TaxID=863751 RepID=UPI0034CDC75A